jgi:uncharacterized hydrophobic protein (TIGR00271 family)
MPLLRVTCPSERTDRILHLLLTEAGATELTVVTAASRITGGDLILAEVPRSAVDEIIERVARVHEHPDLHLAVQQSERLVPAPDEDGNDEDAVIWAQVVQDVHETGRLSWINVALFVVAACIAAIGIMQDQLLLIVGAMALSPDYYPVADACLSVIRRDGRRLGQAMGTIAVSFAAAIVGAWVLTEVLGRTGVVSQATAPPQELTLFISRPDALSIVVALFAGVAGALAITLPDARGLVGVFVSITTIPAAANIGVAFAKRDWSELSGAAVQLLFNVASLLVAGTVTLGLRRVLGNQPMRTTVPAEGPSR